MPLLKLLANLTFNVHLLPSETEMSEGYQMVKSECGNNTADFVVGERVQAHPATDVWMRGDRYGEVWDIGHKVVTVRMDRSGRLLRFTPNSLMHVEG